MSIIKFPKQYIQTNPQGFKINLYTEKEVEMTLFCMNTWFDSELKITRHSLRGLGSEEVLSSLERGYHSGLLSDDAKKVINKIVTSIEPIITKESLV